MNFAEALILLIQGNALTRRAWAGQSFVSMTPGNTAVPAHAIWSAANRALAEACPGHKIAVQPSLSLAMLAGQIMMGWTPRADDLFADDWLLLPMEKTSVVRHN